MPLKNWILHGMNRMNRVVGRSDLPQRASRGSELHEPSLRGVAGHEPGPEHLGAYAPLIAAIRDELEHFVASQLRLHLAIAERDRYLLTSIEVDCAEGGEEADLLRRFRREFTPEQVKRFLARDVIGHLPNASAIDLAQFAGLDAADGADDSGEDPYRELVEELRASAPSGPSRSFEVTLVGRWTEVDAGAVRREAANRPAPHTPLAGSRLAIEIDDADGHRHLALASVVPNRRYAIGKGDGCEVIVNGTFASRRHCEIWLENGVWWAADAGSTNGIRVESASRVLGRAAGESGAAKAIEIVPGARIVLSAHANGQPADYPRILLALETTTVASATPLSPAAKAPTTPVTPIAAPLKRSPELAVHASMTSGSRTVVLNDKSLPMRIGRSRNQGLVVDWAHEGVSGHHVEIDSVDETGALVRVHGDNGVSVGVLAHQPGASFRWRVGERMTLGRASGDEPECTLTLTNRA